MADTTLAIVWVFTWIAVSVMCLRLILVKSSKQPLSTGEYLTIGAIFCALARLSLIHVVLIWGSNNVSAKFRATHHFTQQDIYRRETGGKLTIVNRLFYNSYLWLQKLVLLNFYQRLMYRLPWERVTMISFLFVFAASYVAVQVVTFTECRPFNLYWQVVPNPGNCSQAQVQLITLGVLNIVTDVMLIALPIPILAKLRRSLLQKIQLYFLFSLGCFIVAITIVRLPQNANHATAQVNRTTWASAELLTAAFVAHAPTLYKLCKRKERSTPRQAQPQTPAKDLRYTSTSEDQTMELRHASGHHELNSGRDFRAHSHADVESGRGNSDTDSHNGILVTSDIRTEYSARGRSKSR